MLIKNEILAKDEDVLLLFLSIALGGNSFLHPYIENCYRKKEWQYYEAFQNSYLKGNALVSMYTTKSEEKIRQVIGILEWSYKNREFTQIDQIIKKGYKFAYQFYHQNQQIDFDDFMRCYARKQKGKVVKEIDLIYQNIVLWYLCQREGKPIKTNNVAWNSFQDVLSASLNEAKIQEVMFSESMLVKHKKEIEDLYVEYNIPKNAHFDTIGTFLDYLISVQLKKIHNIHPNITVEMAEKKVFEVSPTKYIGAMGGWLKTLQIHELDALNLIPFTRAELDIVFLELLYVRKYNYISKNDQDLFFISSLYQKCLASLYRETKKMYLDQSKEDYYLNVQAKEVQIKEQEMNLLRQQKMWETKNKQKQQEIEGLSKEIREANARIRQLEQQIENMEDYSAEVHTLRSLVYKEEKEEEKTLSLPTMIDHINATKIVIIGGAINWQQKLKDALPSLHLFETDEVNRDLSIIRRMDAVFINTTLLSHAFYEKVIKELNRSGTPLFYLSGHSNIEKTIQEIYSLLAE